MVKRFPTEMDMSTQWYVAVLPTLQETKGEGSHGLGVGKPAKTQQDTH